MHVHGKIPASIILWLLALSFWSGGLYMQVSQNTQMIQQDRLTRIRIWDRLSDIDQRLSVIQGALEGRNK